jgi:hypothetical protein
MRNGLSEKCGVELAAGVDADDRLGAGGADAGVLYRGGPLALRHNAAMSARVRQRAEPLQHGRRRGWIGDQHDLGSHGLTLGAA